MSELFPLDGHVVDVPGTHLRRGLYRVESVPLSLAREFVGKHHYTRGGANTGVAMHGLVHVATGRVDGVAWWIPPTRGAAESVFPEGDWRRVLSLHRLVVMPGVPTNGASFLLGGSIRILRREGAWDCLVTYADEGEGHTGAIYRATNWEYTGKTAAEARWVDPHTGRHIARKAGGNTRTRGEMEALGYTRKDATRKHRFRMGLR